MDRASAKQYVHGVVHAFVPSNARKYNFGYINPMEPAQNTLGFFIDPRPMEGTVVAFDDLLLVKTGRIQFIGVPASILRGDELPQVGDKVQIVPYARRKFDGRRFDEPNVETRTMPDGTQYEVKTLVIGGGHLEFPLETKPTCPELAEMIRQMTVLPAPGSDCGYRRIVHMIADAGGKDFRLVDPVPEKIIETPPELSFHVSTAMFQGRVAVRYNRGSDTYEVHADSDHAGRDPIRIEDVHFIELGEVFERIFDDGSWAYVTVNITKRARRPRAKAH
ncbi:GTPase [Denitratimonas sp. CY0512]|uniref:GTPase n=1 Tax=Denitratimonas sp. CY0512 TaxID=3131940 RepID=UPI00309EF78F